MRTLALPMEVEHWSLTTLREKLVKIRAKVVLSLLFIPSALTTEVSCNSWPSAHAQLALTDIGRESKVPCGEQSFW